MRRSAVAAAVLLALAPSGRADIVDRIDQPAAELSCKRWWNGKAPAVTKPGGRLVVVHFSDPTQITSTAFVSSVRKLIEKNKGRPLDVVEIVIGTDEKAVDSYIAKQTITWTIGLDAKGATARGYAGSSIPRSYLIGPDGRVAYHAHINTITKEILEAQYARVPFFTPKSVPPKCKALAKHMTRLEFGKALKQVEKILGNPRSKDADKAMAETAKREVKRYFELQFKLLEKTVKDLDWALAWRRAERMKVVYKGTPYQKQVDDKCRELADNPRVPYHRAGHEWLEKIVRKTNLRRKKELEASIAELDELLKKYGQSVVGKKAREWKKEFQRLLKGL